MNKKNIIYVVIILILTAVIAGGFLVWSGNLSYKKIKNADNQKKINVDEIESVQDLVDGNYKFPEINVDDWQIYENKEQGFEFKMPSSWEFKEDYRDNNDVEYNYFGGLEAAYAVPEGMKSDVTDKAVLISSSYRYNPDAMSLREFIEKRKNGYGEKVYLLSMNKNMDALIIGENLVIFYVGDRKWGISFQLYHNNERNINKEEYETFLGIVKSFKLI